jgi:hypothetical protein
MRRSLGRLPRLALLLLASILACAPLQAQSGTTSVSAKAARQAAELLGKAPAGPFREGTLATEEFLAQARQVTGGRPSTVEEAVSVLEWLAQTAGSVVATVESVPAGLAVQYHRTYRTASPNDPTVTTDGTESLDVPTYYVFEARDPYTGRIASQTKNCLRGCTVRFVFTRPPR